MRAYLLTAAGVIFLSVVVSLLMPEGKLHKSVTFIMRMICIAVLIQPVTGLFKTISTENAAAWGFIDYGYVSSVYSSHQSGELEKLIKEKFGANAVCTVEVGASDGKFEVIETAVRLEENNGALIEEIYEYLSGLGYINITVYAQST